MPVMAPSTSTGKGNSRWPKTPPFLSDLGSAPPANVLPGSAKVPLLAGASVVTVVSSSGTVSLVVKSGVNTPPGDRSMNGAASVVGDDAGGAAAGVYASAPGFANG